MPRTPKSAVPSKRKTAATARKAPARESAENAETAEAREADDEDLDSEETGESSDDEETEGGARADREDGEAAETSGSDDADDHEPATEDGAESEDVDVPAELPAESSGGSLARFDPMAAYLREVQRHPLLTPEQTHELAVRFVKTQDPAAAAQLVTSNLRLVVKIAYEYRRAYKNIMDLVQEGNIGLMQAVKRYDPYRGVKLSSYAAWWIRAYILRFVLNNWRLVKLGTTQAQRKLFFNLRKKRAVA